jgi:hypothetical protein
MADLTAVTGLARLHLDDVDADVFTDALLITYVNSAYRQLQQVLAINGSSTMKKTSAAIAVAASSTSITLPTDQWLPLKLWERETGAAADAWVDMQLVDELPDVLPGAALTYWKFENNTITFIGATRNNQVRVEYVLKLPALVAPSSLILIPYGEDFLAWMTAAYAARARGEADFAKDCIDMAGTHLKALLVGHVRHEQRKNFRARPYGMR